MTPAARVAGAIEVLADLIERRRPAPDALKDWGLARRFAGSKDRAAIASLVYDALRRRASSAWVMAAADFAKPYLAPSWGSITVKFWVMLTTAEATDGPM